MFGIVGFAGFGGSCLGYKMALGRSPDIAMNHNRVAMSLHRANNPDTFHVVEDIWKAKPGVLCSHRRYRGRFVPMRKRNALGRRPMRLRHVDWAWFSPDCRDFSRAKGKKPVRKYIRGLAWVAVAWAREVRPDRIIIENVREFKDWGPLIPLLDADGQKVLGKDGKPEMIPDPARRGETFRKFMATFAALGYIGEVEELDACDYGAPTHRKRLLIILRCDGMPIVWPKKTHGPGRANPWRTAAECIDWSIPAQSIFDRKKALAPNTLRRLAHGVKRFVIDSATPFIVGVGGPEYSGKPRGVDRPFGTVTAENHSAVAVPYLVECAHGRGAGRVPGEHTLEKPLGTIVGSNNHALACASLARIGQTGGNGSYTYDLIDPLTTITSKAEHLLSVATLMQVGYGERKGQAPRVPGLDKPLGTVVGTGKHALVAASLTKLYGTCKDGVPVDVPMPTVTGGGQHIGVMAAWLDVYYKSEASGQALNDPLRTVVSKDRFSLCVAFLREQKIIGENELPIVWIGGVAYVIVDIGMRMLTPRELARAQGFPDSYVLDRGANGKTISKKDQVKCIGNSVPPPLAAAVIRANNTFAPRRKAVAA